MIEALLEFEQSPLRYSWDSLSLKEHIKSWDQTNDKGRRIWSIFRINDPLSFEARDQYRL